MDPREALRQDPATEVPLELSLHVRQGGACYEFDLVANKPFRYVRPVLLPAGGDPLRARQRTMVTLTPPEPRERYPVLYMNDGTNLFFPEEAFPGRDWTVDSTMDMLVSMRLVDKTIVVGVHAGQGVARGLRLCWVCLSSTLGWRDYLLERGLTESKRPARFNLDSGWPGDNDEVTVAMAVALKHRGWVYGQDLLHLGYPEAKHEEPAWADRLPIPFQFLLG